MTGDRSDTPAERSSSPKWLTLSICLLLAGFTIAVYAPVRNNGLINFDDPDYVAMNSRVQAGLSADGVRWAFSTFHSSNWHPLTWLSHMLDCQLFGPKPAGHHLMSLLFHVANSLLLFGLFRELTGALWRSALVAAFFGLHPLHVESVAWVAERKDVLSTFFFLLTLWAYARFARRRCSLASTAGRPATGWYLLSLLLFALGLMCKPMLVTTPFVLLLLDFWPLNRLSLPATGRPARFQWGLLWEKAPFFALSLGSSIVTFLAQRASGSVVSLANQDLDARLAHAILAYGQYVIKTLWPANLAVFYPYASLEGRPEELLLTTAALLAVTVGFALAARRQPYLIFGWLWFLGTLVPVIGLVQVGKQALADRYTYLPHIGLFCLLIWGAADLLRRWRAPRWAGIGAGVLALAACGVLTTRQVRVWRTTTSLFQHTAAVTKGNFVAYGVLASEFTDQGKYEEAIDYCREALRFASQYAEAYNVLGNVYALQGKLPQAIENYQEAIRCDPLHSYSRGGLANALLLEGRYAEAETRAREALDLAPMNLAAAFTLAKALHEQGKLPEAATCYQRLLEADPKAFVPRRGLGNVLLLQGKAEEAIVEFSRAIEARPEDADTRVVLGVALMQKGRVDEASSQFLEALRLQPTNAVANYQLALIRQSQMRPVEAADLYRAALGTQPNWPEALNNLAWLLASSFDPNARRGEEAVTLAQRACALTGFKEAILVGTLAAAYAEAGQFKEAVATAEQARQIALAAGQKEVAQRNQELLELYATGKAFHEKAPGGN